jgi:hypothetical protein
MRASVKTLIFSIMFCLAIVSAKPVKAQCAQCAATVETNTKNGGNAARGLNKGILFLLGAPYLVVAVGGYIWYKNYRRKNVSLDVRDEKLNLN